MDTKSLVDAFVRRDVEQVIKIMRDCDISEPTVGQKFVELLRQSGAMVVKFPTSGAEKKRTALREACEAIIKSCDDSCALEDIEAHFQDAELAERGFRTIRNTISKSMITQRSADVQVWGVLHRAVIEAELLRNRSMEKVESMKKETKKIVSLDDFKITDENGQPIDSDGFLASLSTGTRLVIFSLAYENKWFSKEKVVVLPDEPVLNEEVLYEAGTHTLLSAQWAALERAWDRSRLFRSRFSLQQWPDENRPSTEMEVLTIGPPDEFAKASLIASERLCQLYYQHFQELQQLGPVNTIITSRDTPPFDLPPAQSLSEEELASCELLSETFCLPFLDPNFSIFGLTLPAWIRGYGVLIKLANDRGTEKLRKLGQAELEQYLKDYGLTSDQAKAFIANTCLVDGSDDLFDTPLINTVSGNFVLFTPALMAMTPWRVVLSRITSLNRIHIEGDTPANMFKNKGSVFEAQMKKLLKDAGLKAEGFNYRIDGTTYDCDLCLILDEILFVFECKNYGLAFDHVPNQYYSKKNLQDFASQVRRIACDLDSHPEVVREIMGGQVSWKRVIPVVLQAMPWSQGLVDGVYFYDASAMIKLIQDGIVRIIATAKIGGNPLLRRHGYPLRKGSTPTADELIRELENPIQLKLSSLGWCIRRTVAPLSESLCLEAMVWHQRPITIKERMIALGSSADEAEQISQEFTTDFPKEIDRINKALGKGRHMNNNVRKVGRNDKCPCGSGIKYKKCCGP